MPSKLRTRTTTGSLTPYIPAHNTTITLTIPPSLGPSGQYYKLAAYGFSNPDTSLPATTANYVVQSDASIFYLTNGTGAWTPAETAEELNYHGLTGAGNADIPCEAYACARACAGKQVPVGQAWEKGSAWRTCLAECEGVFVDEERVAEAGYPEMEDVVVPERLPVPGEECEVDGSDLRTPCGESCCRSRQYCYRYESCLELIEGWSAPGEEEEEEEEETTTASARLPEATETAARTTGPADAQSTGGVAGWVEEQKKGGSAAVSLDWWALGAIVGVLGPIVGAMG
jgi:hypothetical protein